MVPCMACLDAHIAHLHQSGDYEQHCMLNEQPSILPSFPLDPATELPDAPGQIYGRSVSK